MAINPFLLKKIKKIGIDIDHNSSFGGKSKGNQHLFRVVKLALFLQGKEGGDVDIVEAGAWLHDTALPTGDDYNPQKNFQIISDILQTVDLSQSDLQRVCECVAFHEGTEVPPSLEAKIVHDADVIEKLGILGVIRHTWKMTNFGNLDSEHITHDDAQAILDHIAWREQNLYLETSKEIAQKMSVPLSVEEVLVVMPHISKLASQGVITEEIAIQIGGDLGEEYSALLKNQLLQTYLSS